MHVHLSPVSSNAKTGPIPVSTTESASCPPSCPFSNGGCYAKSGPLALHWRAVSAKSRGAGWNEFCGKIAALPKGQLWRHNQAGDLPGEGEEIDAEKLAALVAANKGRRGFTYSHKSSPRALKEIRKANASGFTVNLSANDLVHADTLADTGAGPVVVVLPVGAEKTVTPAGRRVIICPAESKKGQGITCATCGLCAVATRKVIVGFPAHGTGKRKASAIASAERGDA